MSARRDLVFPFDVIGRECTAVWKYGAGITTERTKRGHSETPRRGDAFIHLYIVLKD